MKEADDSDSAVGKSCEQPTSAITRAKNERDLHLDSIASIFSLMREVNTDFEPWSIESGGYYKVRKKMLAKNSTALEPLHVNPPLASENLQRRRQAIRSL